MLVWTIYVNMIWKSTERFGIWVWKSMEYWNEKCEGTLIVFIIIIIYLLFIIVFILHLHFGYCFLSHFRCWRKNSQAVAFKVESAMAQESRIGIVEGAEEPEDQRSTDATEGTDVPNVLVKPTSSSLTFMSFQTSKTFVHLWNINVDLFREISAPPFHSLCNYHFQASER